MSALDTLNPGTVTLQPSVHQLYALRDDDGQFVHHSLTRHPDGALRMTEVRDWRWRGKLSQLDAVRRLHPETRKMVAVKLPMPMRDKEVYK